MFVLGVGIGLDQGRSALAVVEAQGDTNNLRHLEHAPLGLESADTVKRILLLTASLPRCSLVIDEAGPGRSIIDQLRAEDRYPIDVSITGAGRVSFDHGCYMVPLAELANGLQTGLKDGHFKIDQALPEAHSLEMAFTEFGRVVNQRGREDGAVKGGQWDSVLAIALAVWWLDFTDTKDYKLHSTR